MLLYALYTPAKITATDYKKVFAFASVESCIHAMRHYNFGKDKLELVTSGFLKEMAVSAATLLSWDPGSGHLEEKCLVFVNGNSVKESWLGRHQEVHLVEYAADEILPDNARYP